MHLAPYDSEIFVSVKPYHFYALELEDTLNYQGWLAEDKVKVDTKVLIEIIQNSKKADTTNWNDIELDSFILVKYKVDTVDLDYVIKKFKPKSKEKFDKYKTLVTDFNKIPYSKKVFKISRPIFDNSKKYAVLIISGGKHLGGGGYVNLFHFKKGKWLFLSTINLWHT